MKIETVELFEKIKNMRIDSDATVSSLFEKHIKFLQIVPWLHTEKYSAFFIVNDHTPELHFIENNNCLTLMKFINLNFPDIYMNYSIVEELLYKENKIKVLTYNNRFINLDIDILLTGKKSI